jgi:hypothetical protein
MFDQCGTVVDMQTGLWEVAVDFLKAQGLEWQSLRLRHLVAADAFRELDDRRPAAT